MCLASLCGGPQPVKCDSRLHLSLRLLQRINSGVAGKLELIGLLWITVDTARVD
jgi:hypothetical protein